MELLPITEFINLYSAYISHPTWTKEKRKHHDTLRDFLNKHKSVGITRKAGVYSLRYLNEFTIIRIPNKKTYIGL